MPQNNKPDWQRRRFRCNKCEHVWDDWLPMFCPFNVWIAVAKAMRCPHCGAGARRIVFGDLKRSVSAADAAN